MLLSDLKSQMDLASIARALGFLVVAGLGVFLYKLYHVRMMFRRVQREHGIEILPHSFLFGHLVVLAKTAMKYKMPRDAHGQIMPLLLSQAYPEIAGKGYVYMDIWPIGPPMLSVFHPDMMAQFTQDNSQLKHPGVGDEFRPYSNADDLVCSDGPKWKTARAIFNPGFSAKNLMSMIPAFVEEAEVFHRRLSQAAQEGRVIKLESLTTDLTVDIIARAVLDTRLHAQTQPCRLMDAMLEQVSHLYFQLDLHKRLDPRKYFQHRRLNQVFREELMPYIEHTVRNYEKLEGPKTVLKLALKSYVEETANGVQSNKTNNCVPQQIPESFLEQVVSHIKMFLLAGHDTTATTLAYAYYEMSRNPSTAAAVRAEHDAVLGPNPAEAAARIAAEPTLLNQLPYTLAVVKETLRLYPIVGTVRVGAPNFTLTCPETRERIPAAGFMLFGVSYASQRWDKVWKDPNAFRPLERWTTTDPKDPWYPPRNAFRPWEMGPRNCIGQELASLELRLILALTVREFSVDSAYPESEVSDKSGVETFLGEVAYQTQPAGMITAHPKSGLPVRIVKV